MAIAKIPKNHIDMVFWVTALKYVICFLSEYDNHSDNKISLPFMGKFL